MTRLPATGGPTRPPATGGPARPPATVYYDGGCPLCAREIAHYRRRRSAPGALVWIDAAQDDAALAAAGLSREAAMRRFHVRVGETWQIGVPGFVALWERIPAYRWLAVLVRTLRLQAPLQWLYRRFAERRYARRCGGDRCVPPRSPES